MTTIALIIYVLAGLAVVFYIDDGRIRVAVAAALAGVVAWRANRTVKQSLTVEKPSPLEHAATELHEVDDAIDDLADTLDPAVADDIHWADAVRRAK